MLLLLLHVLWPFRFISIESIWASTSSKLYELGEQVFMCADERSSHIGILDCRHIIIYVFGCLKHGQMTNIKGTGVAR